MKVLNFSIVAHVDHGKSTLSTRLIELFRDVKIKEAQFLDDLKVERERGITVRAQAVNLHRSEEHCINLIDTPGHVDFQSEVVKSLMASDLVFLLISARDGIQAQTVNYLERVREVERKFIFVINKIDLSQVEEVERLKQDLRELSKDVDILECSAKTGFGMENLRDYIWNEVHSKEEPEGGETKKNLLILANCRDEQGQIHHLIQNLGIDLRDNSSLSYYDQTGKKKNLRIKSLYMNSPWREVLKDIRHGEIAYIKCNLKECLPIGTYLGDEPKRLNWDRHSRHRSVLIPQDLKDWNSFIQNLEELSSNDYNLNFFKINNSLFGQAAICDTTGELHLETCLSRLEEMGSRVFRLTSWNNYKVSLKKGLENKDLLEAKDIESVKKEILNLEFKVKAEFWDNFNANLSSEVKILNKIWNIDWVILNLEIEANFFSSVYNRLLSSCKGHLSYILKQSRWEEVEFNVIDIYLNEQHSQFQLVTERRDPLIKKFLEDVSQGIERQQVLVNLQARSGQKTLHSVKILPYRKNVTGKCYGGDVSRKMKLLKKQSLGKSRLKSRTTIKFDRDLFVKRGLKKR